MCLLWLKILIYLLAPQLVRLDFLRNDKVRMSYKFSTQSRKSMIFENFRVLLLRKACHLEKTKVFKKTFALFVVKIFIYLLAPQLVRLDFLQNDKVRMSYKLSTQ